MWYILHHFGTIFLTLRVAEVEVSVVENFPILRYSEVAMRKSNKNYQTRFTRELSILQKDLRANKISQEEFNILLGLLVRVEMNHFVRSGLRRFDSRDDKQMTFISYAGTKTFGAV